MRMRNRHRPVARHSAFKLPKRRMLLVVEGAVTEKQYLEGLISTLRTTIVEIRVLGGVGVPMTLVETAIKIKRSAMERASAENDHYLEYDEIWCAFDVDQHPKIPEARKLADQQNVHLAISNPCFELWLWLHFADSPGVCSPQELQSMLKRFIPDYRKHVRFSDFAEGFGDAVHRAIHLERDAAAAGDPYRNPTTGVWRLAEAIRRTSIDDK